jgi:hypothetical protein
MAWLVAADARRHCARNFADDRLRARAGARRWWLLAGDFAELLLAQRRQLETAGRDWLGAKGYT